MRLLFIIQFSACLLFSANLCFAQQDFFPFLGEITTDRVNVRAGQSENFEKVGRLNQGDQVIVLDRSYSWYKIQLPKIAKTYISKDYVKIETEGKGIVMANRLNLRAGPGTQFSIIGQVSTGEKVNILEETEEWYRIEPFTETGGWVSDNFVAFKSNDIAKYQPPVEKTIDVAKPSKTQTEEKDPIQVVELDGLISIQGILEQQPYTGSRDVRHRIQMNGQTIYYIEGIQPILGHLENRLVNIKGRTNKTLSDKFSYPVLLIQEIQLVL